MSLYRSFKKIRLFNFSRERKHNKYNNFLHPSLQDIFTFKHHTSGRNFN